MKQNVMKEILDVLRDCRDTAILKDDMERAMGLSALILSAGFAKEEKDSYRCFEDSLSYINGVEYLNRQNRSLKPLLNSIGIYYV